MTTDVSISVDSPNLTYGDRYIEADYDYCTTRVEHVDGKYKVPAPVTGLLFSPFKSIDCIARRVASHEAPSLRNVQHPSSYLMSSIHFVPLNGF